MIFDSFHGSPGSPKDFFQLEQTLGGQWTHHDRHGSSKDLSKNSILIGYSWGCRELLRKLEKQADVGSKQIIFISPYFFTNPAGRPLKCLLSIPGLAQTLLRLIGPKAIQKFIASSSLPEKPSEAYTKELEVLSRPKVLKQSLMEKDRFTFPHLSPQNEILILWAENDQTSLWESQMEPWIETTRASIQIQRIPGAGHALVWNSHKKISNYIQSFIEKTKVKI